MNFMTKKDVNEQNIESTRGYTYLSPDVDLYENKDGFRIVFDLPGIDKEDIKINVEKEILTVTAECHKNPDENYKPIREETEFTGMRRSFNLNKAVDTEKINAEYKDGVLYLDLPKKEEEKSKEVTIKVS